MVTRLVKNGNFSQDEQMLNGECIGINMDITDKESTFEQICTPEFASNTPTTNK